MTYSSVKHQENKIIALQQLQLQMIMHNELVTRQCVCLIYTQLQNYLQWVKNIHVFRLKVNIPMQPSVLNPG